MVFAMLLMTVGIILAICKCTQYKSCKNCGKYYTPQCKYREFYRVVGVCKEWRFGTPKEPKCSDCANKDNYATNVCDGCIAKSNYEEE